MSARIIGQNHEVTSYTVTDKNGRSRKKFVIEDKPESRYRHAVNNAVFNVGRAWADVYNWLDQHNYDMDNKSLNNAIDKMTY